MKYFQLKSDNSNGLNNDLDDFFLSLFPVLSDASFLTSQGIAYQYFNFIPSLESIPFSFSQFFRKAELINKYYFIGKGNNFLFESEIINNQTFKYLISFCFACNPILSSTSTNYFYKLYLYKNEPKQNSIKYNHFFQKSNLNFKINMFSLFRSIFPNKYIFQIAIKCNMISPSQINIFFSELLTSPLTQTLSTPYIVEYLQYFSDLEPFMSTLHLLNYFGALPSHKLSFFSKT